jgi:hypothetical protein
VTVAVTREPRTTAAARNRKRRQRRSVIGQRRHTIQRNLPRFGQLRQRRGDEIVDLGLLDLAIVGLAWVGGANKRSNESEKSV